MDLLSEVNRIREMITLSSTFSWNEFLIREDIISRVQESSDADILLYRDSLGEKLRAWTRAEQMQESGAVFEVYGEVACLLELQDRAAPKGCSVRRFPAGPRAKVGLATPDFVATGPDGDFYIEVKVLDMAGGQWAGRSLAYKSLENHAELDARLKPGVNFSAPLEIAPLGESDPSKYSLVIDNYIQRICSNIKKAQLSVGPTFLMIFDARIPLDNFEPTCLVPCYFDNTLAISGLEGECLSGDWWQVALGQSGDLILGRSEFEGKGNLRGRQQANGVLVDHPYLLGLSILSQKMSAPKPTINTLTQISRENLSEEEQFLGFDPSDTAYLFSDNYNDSKNSYGFKYQVKK